MWRREIRLVKTSLNSIKHPQGRLRRIIRRIEPFIIAGSSGPLYITSSSGGSVRWAAPEHFRFSDGSHVSTVMKHGDVYSYGSVMLQVRAIKEIYIVRFASTDHYSGGFNSGTIREAALSSFVKLWTLLINLDYGIHPTPCRSGRRILGADVAMLDGGPMYPT